MHTLFGSLLLGIAAAASIAAQVQDKSIRPLNAAHKVALVIGNSNYAWVPKIPPAANDAADMADALRKLGFDVELKTDLGGEALVAAVGRFSRGKVQAGDLALVYYSGHGGQIAGENYLLPVDYQPPSEDDLVDRRAYRMSLVRDALERTGASVRVLIFDACRDSPVTTSKSVATGLRGMSGKAEGTLIAYASADNQVARYETGQRNSFYTGELVTALNQGRGDLKTLLEQVQQRVFLKTQRQQTPYLYGFLSAPLYLGAGPAESATLDLDMERYAAVKDSRDPAQLEAVAAQLRRADLAGILRERAKALRSAAAPPPAVNTPPDRAELRKQADAAYQRQEYSKALDLFRQLAGTGDAWGMYSVAFQYEYGQGVAKDDSQAAAWYRKAAEAGYLAAMTNLGLMYGNGRGVPRNEEEAVKWYRQAAAGNEPAAMANLGRVYEWGNGVTRDMVKAVEWYRKAADAGYPGAMERLGLMYELGEGVPKDEKQAFFWFKKAADAGNSRAMESLAQVYEYGKGAVPVDYKEAMKWRRKSADAGDHMAMCNLGMMYEGGDSGVAKDLEQAVYWYKKAVAAGDEFAGDYLKRLGR